MSERTTGATDEQITAAAKRADDSWGFGEEMPHILGPEVRGAAPFLVPPGYVIARAADCITADQRAAIGRMLAHVEAEIADVYDIEEQTYEDIELIRTIANGGTDDQ